MLSTSQIATYATTLALAAAIPGPGITALVARSVSAGTHNGLAMLLGLILGDLVYLSLAVFGLALMAHLYSAVFSLINLLAAGYLAWLGWRFLRFNPQGIELAGVRVDSRALLGNLLAGFAITLGNPKTIAFYLSILPLVISLERVTVHTWLVVLVPVTVLVLLLVGGGYVLGAVRVRRFLASRQAQQLLFRGAGLMMLIAAVSMLAKMWPY